MEEHEEKKYSDWIARVVSLISIYLITDVSLTPTFLDELDELYGDSKGEQHSDKDYFLGITTQNPQKK